MLYKEKEDKGKAMPSRCLLPAFGSDISQISAVFAKAYYCTFFWPRCSGRFCEICVKMRGHHINIIGERTCNRRALDIKKIAHKPVVTFKVAVRAREGQ